jgi:hypothetical protein
MKKFIYKPPYQYLEPEESRLPPAFPFLLWVAGAFILMALMLHSCVVQTPAVAAEVDMAIIAQIESGGNTLAYNRHSGARGIWQITPIVLREYNEEAHKELLGCYENGFLVQPIAYTKQDLFNPIINKQIAEWYFNRIKNHYLKNKGSIDDILICYNFGYGNWLKWEWGIKRLPQETRKYIKLYKELMNER